MSAPFRSGAPAYQEYAADWLARREFRTMTLAQRGLLFTLRFECWANVSVPSDLAALAKILGVDRNELLSLMDDSLRCFFEDDGENLTMPDLEKYRAELTARRDKQAQAAQETNKKRRMKKADAEQPASAGAARDAQRGAQRDANRTVDRAVPEMSGTEQKRSELAEERDESREYAKAWDRCPDPPAEYARASRGS